MNDILESLTHHPRLMVKIVIGVAAAIGLIFKIIVPKLKERANRVNEAAANHRKNDFLSQGIRLYHQGKQEEGIRLMIKGFELGSFDKAEARHACAILVRYYDELDEQYNSLRWGRFAVENHCFNQDIIEYMISQYEDMGETAKAEELKDLLKNS